MPGPRPPAPSRLGPAQRSIARINASLASVGRAPRELRPVGPTFQNQGYGAARLVDEEKATGRGGGGRDESTAGSIRSGEGTFDRDSGRGRLEWKLKKAVADIEEGRESGQIAEDEADEMLRRAAKITEGLYDGEEPPEWMQTDEGVQTLLRGGSGKSALDQIKSAGADAGNVLLKGLEVADTPRSYVVASALELGDAARAIAGKDPMGDRGRIRDRGFSLQDIRDNAKAHVGVGDILQQNTLTDQLPLPVRQGLGFLGDVALDPLTFVGFGTTLAGRGAMRAADAAVPGVRATLRKSGVKGLTAADRAAVERAIGERGMRLLETAQGGVRVRTPVGKWSEGKTVLAGDTIRKPFRALRGTDAVKAASGSRLGEVAKVVGRTADDAFRPRAAIYRGLGDDVAHIFDDVRVQLSHTAGQQAQRELDKVIDVARKTKDLTGDELRDVGRALDIGGTVDQLPDRLRPLHDAIDRWRQTLTTEQVDAGVLIGRDARQEGLELAADAKAATLRGLHDKLSQVDAKIAQRTAEVDAVLPRIEPAVQRATDAGYSGGRADAVLAEVPKAQAAAGRAAARVDELEGRAAKVAEDAEPAVTPVDAPITAADRTAMQEAVDDLAQRAADELRHADIGVSLIPLPDARGKAKLRGGEWDWIEQLDPHTRAAYQRLADTATPAPLGPQAQLTGWQQQSAAGLVGPESPDLWTLELGVDRVDEAVEIVMDRVRRYTALDQLSRGSAPWWPEYAPVAGPVDEAIMRALPVDSVQSYASNVAANRVQRTAYGEAVHQLDQLIPGASRRIADEGPDAFIASLDPARFTRISQGWQTTVPKRVKGGGMVAAPVTIKPLTDRQAKALMAVMRGGDDALVVTKVKQAPGRRSWPSAAARDKVVRAHRQGIIDELEGHLAAQGVDLPPNVREHLEPGYREGQQLGRAEGRVAEAEYVAGGAERAAVAAQARAGTAAGRAEGAADRAMEAIDSAQRQATRAAEQSLERGKKVAQATRPLQIKKAKLKQAIAKAERELAEAERLVARGTIADEDYLPRILTPDAYKVMKAMEPGGKMAGRGAGTHGIRNSVTGDKFVTARKDEWYDMSIQEINAEMADLMEEAHRLDIIDDPGAEWFDSNPITAFAQRDPVARRHIVAKQFYMNLLHVTGEDGGRVAMRLDELGPELAEDIAAAERLRHGTPGAKEMATRRYFDNAEWEAMDVPSLGVGVPPETIVVRREIADELRRLSETFADPGRFEKFVDDWQQLWKAYATVPLPFGLGFHLRNAQGNVFLNWVRAGMLDIGAYVKAFRLQVAANRNIRKFGDPFVGMTDEDAQLLRWALDNGVIGDGFFQIEVGRAKDRFVTDTRGRSAVRGERKSRLHAINPFSTDMALISAGRKFGSSVENNARLAHFLWAMKNHGNPTEAARSVRTTLFDYGDVTKFERKVMKRPIPFYTFMRKSAPALIEGFALSPHRLSRIQQIRMQLAQDAEPVEGMYPGYMAEQAGVPLPMGVSRALAKIPGVGFEPDEQVVFMPDLPMLATAENLTDALAVAGAAPLVPNLTDRSAREGAGGLYGLIAGGMPGAISAGTQAVLGRRFFGDAALSDKDIEASLPARLLGLDRPRDLDGDGELEPTMTQTSDFMLESLFPLAPKVPWGTKAEADKAPRRTMSMLTGLRFYPLGEATQEGEAYQRLDDLERYIEGFYRRGKLTEGPDAEHAEDLLREEIEAQVRRRYGIREGRALTPEAREEVKRQMEAA